MDACESSYSRQFASGRDPLSAEYVDAGLPVCETPAMRYSGKVEYAQTRKIREKNTNLYRLAHWPIWIWVFFLAPGPLTFRLFAQGFGLPNLVWLLLVLTATGIAGWRGKLPGVEPRPYILRFDEEKPNPLYRRICYTFAWNALASFALLNIAGLAAATLTGKWQLRQIYDTFYFPLWGLILVLGFAGWLPRVGSSTLHEGTERRYFYGSVWAVTIAQTALLVLWQMLPSTRLASLIKLIAFLTVLLSMSLAAYRGRLPRTRPIIRGELMVAD